jgi:hypothetical protein
MFTFAIFTYMPNVADDCLQGFFFLLAVAAAVAAVVVNNVGGGGMTWQHLQWPLLLMLMLSSRFPR